MDLYNDDSAAAVLARRSPCSSSTLKWLHCCIPSTLLSPNIPSCIGGEWESSTGWTVLSFHEFGAKIRLAKQLGTIKPYLFGIYQLKCTDLWTKFTNGHRLTVHRLCTTTIHQQKQQINLIQFESAWNLSDPNLASRPSREKKNEKRKINS